MPDDRIADIALAPIVVGLVELVKQIPGFPSWLAAPVAVGVGVLLHVAWTATQPAQDAAAWVTAVLRGLALGLSAAGLYSGVRAVVQAR